MPTVKEWLNSAKSFLSAFWIPRSCSVFEVLIYVLEFPSKVQEDFGHLVSSENILGPDRNLVQHCEDRQQLECHEFCLMVSWQGLA